MNSYGCGVVVQVKFQPLIRGAFRGHVLVCGRGPESQAQGHHGPPQGRRGPRKGEKIPPPQAEADL